MMPISAFGMPMEWEVFYWSMNNFPPSYVVVLEQQLHMVLHVITLTNHQTSCLDGCLVIPAVISSSVILRFQMKYLDKELGVL